MRLRLPASLVFALSALAGCTCADTVSQTRFACEVTADCLPDNVCRGGECRSEVIPTGFCFPGERQTCTVATCDRPCGADGGWQGCEPSTGPGFETNPLHCGACGRQCSTRLGDSLSCIGGRCTCTIDLDCPSGDVCGVGGVCVMDSDPCARLACDAGAVCRAGACAPVGCAQGCRAGEVCELASSQCRAIDPCHFAAPCGDGGVCEGGPKPDGEACADGVACTFGDSCRAGACAGTGYSCPAPAQCELTVACAGDGGCEATAVPDGTPCEDGVRCTQGDQCVSGACGGTAYLCSPDQCTATSVCMGDGGCAVTPRNVGAPCDDSLACTFGDSCGDAGVCVGTMYACPGVTACKEAGLCLGDGGCDVVNKADTTPCADGVSCTAGDSCTGGVCAGLAVLSFLDSDSDGLGGGTTQATCPLGAGYVLDGGDCDDSNPFIKNTTAAVLDVDQDGVTASSTLDPAACVGAPSTVAGRTYYRSATGAFTWLASASAAADCDDGNAFISATRAVATDADHDGFTTTTSTAQRCTGQSVLIDGGTYFGNATNQPTWLGTASASADCNDADPLVFPQTYYADTDGDGRGAAASAQVQCPRQAGFVANATDCNDASALVYQTIAALYDDGDQDGYSNATSASICVGTTTTVAGRTYYRSSSGAYSYTNTFLGPDCNTGSATLFTSRNNVVRDDDRDGYPANVTDSTQCLGASSTVGTRSYYSNAAGGYWMGRADCIQKMGANCAPGFVDCYDLNSNAAFGQAAYFTVDRGDGSFDYNCLGGVTANSAASWCASTSAGVTVYTDGTCATSNGAATICNGPAAFAAPAACGKNTAGAGTFTNPATCTAETLATATLIGCH